MKLLVILVFCCLSVACSKKSSDEVLPYLTDGLQKKDGLKRYILGFENDGLQQYALLIGSETAKELIVFAHGFHPEPPKYGTDKEGKNDRPGDYYRGLVEAYAKGGYWVLVPDFRGHNKSQGIEFTFFGGGDNPVIHNASDLEAAYTNLIALRPNLGNKTVLLSHSMGTAAVVLAADSMKENVLGLSLWSGGKLMDYDVHPEHKYILHHAVNESVVPVKGSEEFITKLQQGQYQYFPYQSDKHLLEGQNFDLAVKRDLEFIKRLYTEEQ